MCSVAAQRPAKGSVCCTAATPSGRSGTAALWLLLGAAAAMAGGCGMVAAMIVDAPNRGRNICPSFDPPPLMLRWLNIDRQLRITVGPPEASLHMYVLEPRPRGEEDGAPLPPGEGSGVRADPDGPPASALTPALSQREGEPDAQGSDDVEAAAAPRPVGTVLLLPGRRMPKVLMLPMARMLTERGYRCIVVDLRGQGRSSGAYFTFGVRESQDVGRLIDELDHQGLIAGRIGLMGISYGAATAIQAAAADERIAAVVALAPYSSMREVVPQFLMRFAPFPTVFMSEESMDRLIDRAAERAGFDADQASPLKAIAARPTPVLLIHGTHDMLIPIGQARSLEQAAAGPVRLIESRGATHLTLYFDPNGDIRREAPAWFDDHLKNPAEP